MEKELVKQWEENKHKLENYFRTTKQEEYSDYEDIVRQLFKLCIPKSKDDIGWDLEKMTVIDDGEYQGTLIFIIPTKRYQPGVDDYIVTDTYYGSCSGCDTLQGICDHNYGLPNEEQVREYMYLALNLLQKAHWLGTE